MEPNLLTSSEWVSAEYVVLNLFLFAGLAIVAALVFLTAEAVAPSLVYTRQLSPGVKVARIGLYVASAIAAILAIYSFYSAISLSLGMIGQFFPRWWI